MKLILCSKDIKWLAKGCNKLFLLELLFFFNFCIIKFKLLLLFFFFKLLFLPWFFFFSLIFIFELLFFPKSCQSHLKLLKISELLLHEHLFNFFTLINFQCFFNYVHKQHAGFRLIYDSYNLLTNSSNFSLAIRIFSSSVPLENFFPRGIDYNVSKRYKLSKTINIWGS